MVDPDRIVATLQGRGAVRDMMEEFQPAGYEIDLEEERVKVTGPDMDLEIKGRIPDRWALIVIAAIAGFLGIKEFAI